jgi:hypothetical protein
LVTLVHTLSYKGIRPFCYYGLGYQVPILGAVSIPLLAIPSRLVRGPAQIEIKNLPWTVHVTTHLENRDSTLVLSDLPYGSHLYLFTRYVTIQTNVVPNIQWFVYHNDRFISTAFCFHHSVYINYIYLTNDMNTSSFICS